MPNDVHALLEHSNRGKQSLGLDLASPEGLEILYQLAATADVFLTNKLPARPQKLKIDVDDIRAHNPNIIYVRGTGQGERGPDADKGSYDSLAFWARSGIAIGAKRPEYDLVPVPPGPGFGDSIGAMTIAGGIMGALFHRERTGEATTVDVSLLASGMWAMGQAVALSLLLDRPWTPPPADACSTRCPRNYQTKDGRTLIASPACRRQVLAVDVRGHRPARVGDDPRFADHVSLLANSVAGRRDPDRGVRPATLAEWRERLGVFTGQWAVVQDTLEVAADPQSVANGYVQECETATGPRSSWWPRPCSSTGSPPSPTGRRSSTSTATPSWPSSASTGTPSWTSRSAASSPDTTVRQPPREET